MRHPDQSTAPTFLRIGKKNKRHLRCLLQGFACIAILGFTGCSEFISPDITGRTIVMNSPQDSLFSADVTTNFWWEADADIEQYNLQLSTAGSGNNTLVADTLLTANAISFDLLEGAYVWKLRGVNAGSETATFQGVFFMDRTAPYRAIATRLNGDTLLTGASDSLTWSSADSPLLGRSWPVHDTLILYRKNDSTTVALRQPFAEGSPRSWAFNTSAPQPMNGPGIYYWRLITVDRAGNRTVGDRFSFIIQ